MAGLVESTLRRVFLISFAPILKYALGQSETVLDFRRIMDASQAVIYDLGRVQDPIARRLLGCLITTSYEMAALSRQIVHPTERPPHHLILDEFAQFSAQTEESLAGILAQTRKYGLCLTLSHQTWSQASRGLQSALQNVGVRIAFRVGREDAESLARVFGRIDPTKLEGGSEGHGRPIVVGTEAQWESWIQALTELPPRNALVKIPEKPAAQIRTIDVPSAVVSIDAIEAVKAEYRRRLMRRKGDIVMSYEPADGPAELTRTAPIDGEDEDPHG